MAKPTGGKKKSTKDDRFKPFDPRKLDKTVIAMPLLAQMEEASSRSRIPVIIDINLDYAEGREQAKTEVVNLVEQITTQRTAIAGTNSFKTKLSGQYVFVDLTRAQIQRLVTANADHPKRPIYKVWPDFEVEAQLTESVSTVKADAARAAFSADGSNIVWAVIDSGIDGSHEHFKLHDNLTLDEPLRHVDFVRDNNPELAAGELPIDEHGHGTHVAGIVAGEYVKPVPPAANAVPQQWVVERRRDSQGDHVYQDWCVDRIQGVAPLAKLVSLRVLGKDNKGRASDVIAALEWVHQKNGYGRWLHIQGVNLSVGYEFDAEWFGCGQSPLCVEVDRLVRSGVVVVTAAGNTGYGYIATKNQGTFKTGLSLSINDPGNAAMALTVGSVHRDKPHVYGVSFFSSKGPTGDGRMKPDLVAPGEKIISCAAGTQKTERERKLGRARNVGDTAGNAQDQCNYLEQSGTSMAAPHVSGAIAAFLSIRREFIGDPERVGEIFCDTATDLKRDHYFQGAGLVDLMRAIQSV